MPRWQNNSQVWQNNSQRQPIKFGHTTWDNCNYTPWVRPKVQLLAAIYCAITLWLKALAPININGIAVTWDTSQFDKSWLKDIASANMASMSVTRDTSHLDRSWLKEAAPRNILRMSVAADTSQIEISWLKVDKCALVRSWNTPVMTVTLETSHPEISSLKSDL